MKESTPLSPVIISVMLIIACFIGILLGAVIMDIARPYKPKQTIIKPDYIILPEQGSYDKKTDGNIYYEVTILNRDYKEFHQQRGIDKVYDHDWVETANALGVPTDCLTIEMYLDYLK